VSLTHWQHWYDTLERGLDKIETVTTKSALLTAVLNKRKISWWIVLTVHSRRAEVKMRHTNGRPEQNWVFEPHWSKLVLPYLPSSAPRGSALRSPTADGEDEERDGVVGEDCKLECEGARIMGGSRRSGRKSVAGRIPWRAFRRPPGGDSCAQGHGSADPFPARAPRFAPWPWDGGLYALGERLLMCFWASLDCKMNKNLNNGFVVDFFSINSHKK
jgi:hypothetical protein